MTRGTARGREVRDDTGRLIRLPDRVRRVVSLVPSLTEAVAATDRGLLVGATDWCSQPADLHVPRVRGTKNPDVSLIAHLNPDVVLANFEENREIDLEALRHKGIAVYVTEVRTVDDAFGSLGRMLLACGLGEPAWLVDARRAWATARPVWPDGVRCRAVVPIWRRPWMAVGSGTFTGDVLRRLGVDNVLADHDERYPKIDLAALPGHDLVVLPDEPYEFAADDGPEAFPGVDCALVSGRYLTWYGPSLVDAVGVLTEQFRSARRFPHPP